MLLVGSASDPDSDDPGVDWLKLGIGIVFLLMAAKQWTERPKPGEEPRCRGGWRPSTRDTAARSPAGRGAVRRQPEEPRADARRRRIDRRRPASTRTDTAIAVAVFVVIGSLTVAGSVLFYLLAGDRAARPLAAVKEFMSDHNAVIMMVVLLLLGAKLLGDGIAGLWQ